MRKFYLIRTCLIYLIISLNDFGKLEVDKEKYYQILFKNLLKRASYKFTGMAIYSHQSFNCYNHKLITHEKNNRYRGR